MRHPELDSGSCDSYDGKTLSRGSKTHISSLRTTPSHKERGELLQFAKQTDKNLTSYRLNNLTTGRKAAFTLAEVLITLGIIGVVAAITMPSLIAKYQQIVLKRQFATAYSLLNQAIANATQKNGATFECYYPFNYPGPAARFSECNTFFNAIVNEFKVVSKCTNPSETNPCAPIYKGRDKVEESMPGFETEEDRIGFLNGACPGVKSSNINKGTYYVLSNGMLYKKLQGDRIHFMIDTNGMKGPNKWGYDVFMFAPRLHMSDYSGVIKVGNFYTSCMFAEKGGYLPSEMIKNMHK